MRIANSLAMVGSMQFGLSGPLDCHIYAIRGPEGIVLIDSGAGTHTQQVLRNLDLEYPSVPVLALVLTHSHVDHCGGAAVTKLHTGCKLIAPEPSKAILEDGNEEESGLSNAREQGVYPAGFRMEPCKIDQAVVDGQVFVAAGLEFTAIHVRGHSHDAFCYITKTTQGSWLFSGDVLFYGGILGVINAQGSGMEGYRADLRKLSGRDIQGLFPGHGMFTLCRGQRHVDVAIQELGRGFIPRQIGQGDLLF